MDNDKLYVQKQDEWSDLVPRQKSMEFLDEFLHTATLSLVTVAASYRW